MKREIKFRLILNGVIVGYELHRKGATSHVSIMHSADGDEWHNIVLSPAYAIDHDTKDQVTGLKDKNGLDIYEGDIFNCKRDARHPDGGYIAGTSNYHPESAEIVEFEDGCFLSGHSSIDSRLCARLFWYKRHSWDRIGNQHQHPELLEAK